MQLQARMAAERKSAATVNLILLAVGLVVVLIMLIAVLRGR
jgi:hypothetical protein